MAGPTRSGLVAVLAAVVLPLLAPSPAVGFPAREYAADAFTTTNEVRADRDRHRLKHAGCLQRKAVRHATRMAAEERMFHQDIRAVLRDCRMRKVGENVAFGYRSGEAVVREGWMRSASHRRNVLDRDYRLLGLASRRSDDGTYYTSQVFGVR